MGEEEASSKDIVLRIYGPDLGEKLALAAGYGKRKDYRGVLEPTDPVTQCNRSGNPFVPGMACYLCGQPIPDKSMLSGPEDELYVECEHILPVTEARWFLDLYMTIRQPQDAWTQRAVQLEYAQAHRVCNQAKSNFSFIKTDPISGAPIVNEAGTRKILKSIQLRALKHVGDYQNPDLARIIQGIASTILSRKDVILTQIATLITHINSGVAVQPEYQNMVVLLRTSLLADPSTLPASLQEIHKNWYENTVEMSAQREILFDRFVNQTYIDYPLLRPENIMNTIFYKFEGLPEQYAQFSSSELVLHLLRQYFNRNPRADPTGKTLLSTIYYGIFREVLVSLLANVMPKLQSNQSLTDFEETLICAISGRMEVILKNEPEVRKIFGDPPGIPEKIQKDCETLTREDGREYRQRARELNILSETEWDKHQEVPTAEEDAIYELDGISEKLGNIFRQITTPETALSAATHFTIIAKNEFIDAYPEGSETAKQRAADVVDLAVRLWLGKYDVAVTSRIAMEVYTAILTNREDETKTGSNITMSGGLHARKPLYPKNNPMSIQPKQSHITRRIRQKSSRKSASKKTRKH